MTTHCRSDDIDINKLKIDAIKFLKKIILPIFENHLREGRRDEWEHLIDEGWQEIGLDMSNENTWRKSDGFRFVTTQNFIDQKR